MSHKSWVQIKPHRGLGHRSSISSDVEPQKNDSVSSLLGVVTCGPTSSRWPLPPAPRSSPPQLFEVTHTACLMMSNTICKQNLLLSVYLNHDNVTRLSNSKLAKSRKAM
eukprot:3553979-Amphidinium_carterae.1